jgi:hypothetical protein
VATRQFVETGKSKFSGLDVVLARRRLSALNAARKLDDLSRLHSVGLHKLTGDRGACWRSTSTDRGGSCSGSTPATRSKSRLSITIEGMTR